MMKRRNFSENSGSSCASLANWRSRAIWGDDALEFIDRVGPDQPWFLWTAFHAPHAPYHKPPSQLHT